MRHFLILLLLVIVAVCISEADRAERRRKKLTAKLARLDSNFNNKAFNKADADDESSDRENEETDGETIDNKYGPRYYKKNKKNKYYKRRKSDHKMSWLNVKKGSDCSIKCRHGDVCITGPIDTKPMCVSKKDLKKSLKLFHRYQKQEMKAWKKFKKEKYDHAEAETYPMDKDDKQEIAHTNDSKNQIVEKQNTVKQHKEETNLQVYTTKADDLEVCTSKQFSQMRTRMMGWFHLLHGQDLLARKEHGGNIKQFYKHVSVKKELREHNGHNCECLKSAMWQFVQMDKNADDELTDTEMSLLEENSLEPCMQPYLTSCDLNADSKLSSNEWCCCFSNVVAPCFKKVDEIRKSGEPVAYIPRCDREGYYMREQCEGKEEDKFTCWCVDYNGNETKGTRTNGRAHCSKIAMNGTRKVKSA
ncbi:unnamed protein product [Lymnaea stagnalis]|uniref:Thyroglobulin type-1 domain-containing protein n=1 Tax=Lymnaea stagnalis TaxID=6523 RepID=A0AAV2HD49_LYMST